MSDTVKIEIMVKTNKIGSKTTKVIGFDKEVWDEMSGDERQEVMTEELFNMSGWEWDWNRV